MPIEVQQSASSVRMWLEIKMVLPTRAVILEHALHLQPCPWVEAAGRLVENQHRRIVNERLGQAEALLHTAREAVHVVVALVRQIEQLQHVADHLLAFATRNLIGDGEEIQKSVQRMYDFFTESHFPDSVTGSPAYLMSQGVALETNHSLSAPRTSFPMLA